MKRTYTIGQQLMAYILLLSLFLQSCTGLKNPIVPIKDEQPSLTSITSEQKLPADQQKEIITSDNHITASLSLDIPYNDATDKLSDTESSAGSTKITPLVGKQIDQPGCQSNPINQAQTISVKELTTKETYALQFYCEDEIWKAAVTENASNLSKAYTLPVYIAPGMDLGNIMSFNDEGRKKFIHIHMPQGSKEKYVYINNFGVKGGMRLNSQTSHQLRLSDYNQLRPYFNNETLEITPENCRALLTYTRQYGEAFKRHNGCVSIKNWGNARELRTLTELLSNFSDIQAFKFDCSNGRETEIDEAIINAIQSYEYITEIYIIDCQLNDGTMQDVLSSVRHPERIKILNLQKNYLSAKLIDTLQKQFPNAKISGKNQKGGLFKSMRGLKLPGMAGKSSPKVDRQTNRDPVSIPPKPIPSLPPTVSATPKTDKTDVVGSTRTASIRSIPKPLPSTPKPLPPRPQSTATTPASIANPMPTRVDDKLNEEFKTYIKQLIEIRDNDRRAEESERVFDKSKKLLMTQFSKLDLHSDSQNNLAYYLLQTLKDNHGLTDLMLQFVGRPHGTLTRLYELVDLLHKKGATIPHKIGQDLLDEAKDKKIAILYYPLGMLGVAKASTELYYDDNTSFKEFASASGCVKLSLLQWVVYNSKIRKTSAQIELVSRLVNDPATSTADLNIKNKAEGLRKYTPAIYAATWQEHGAPLVQAFLLRQDLDINRIKVAEGKTIGELSIPKSLLDMVVYNCSFNYHTKGTADESQISEAWLAVLTNMLKREDLKIEDGNIKYAENLTKPAASECFNKETAEIVLNKLKAKQAVSVAIQIQDSQAISSKYTRIKKWLTDITDNHNQGVQVIRTMTANMADSKLNEEFKEYINQLSQLSNYSGLGENTDRLVEKTKKFINTHYQQLESNPNSTDNPLYIILSSMKDKGELGTLWIQGTLLDYYKLFELLYSKGFSLSSELGEAILEEAIDKKIDRLYYPLALLGIAKANTELYYTTYDGQHWKSLTTINSPNKLTLLQWTVSNRKIAYHITQLKLLLKLLHDPTTSTSDLNIKSGEGNRGPTEYTGYTPVLYAVQVAKAQAENTAAMVQAFLSRKDVEVNIPAVKESLLKMVIDHCSDTMITKNACWFNILEHILTSEDLEVKDVDVNYAENRLKSESRWVDVARAQIVLNKLKERQALPLPSTNDGIEDKERERFRKYQKDAEQGYTSAQYNVAMMYKNGVGVTQDYVKAVYWLQKAADQEDIDSQYSLGTMYENGWGVAQDYAKAALWYQKAATQGHAEAKGTLEIMYRNGWITQENTKESIFPPKYIKLDNTVNLRTRDQEVEQKAIEEESTEKEFVKVEEVHKIADSKLQEALSPLKEHFKTLATSSTPEAWKAEVPVKNVEQTLSVTEQEALQQADKIVLDYNAKYRQSVQNLSRFSHVKQKFSKVFSKTAQVTKDVVLGPEINSLIHFQQQVNQAYGSEVMKLDQGRMERMHKERLTELTTSHQQKEKGLEIKRGRIQAQLRVAPQRRLELMREEQFLVNQLIESEEMYQLTLKRLQNPAQTALEDFYDWKRSVFVDFTKLHLGNHFITYEALALGTVARKPEFYEQALQGSTAIGSVLADAFLPLGGLLGNVIGGIAGKGAELYADKQIRIKAAKIGSLYGYRGLEGMVEVTREVANGLMFRLKDVIIDLTPESLDKLAKVATTQMIDYALKQWEANATQTITAANLLLRGTQHQPSWFKSFTQNTSIELEDGRFVDGWSLLIQNQQKVSLDEKGFMRTAHFFAKQAKKNGASFLNYTGQAVSFVSDVVGGL
ncbi:hypothetical protein Aasi_0472 [Candidatus Amoebophilus asiaticus 5a2]|uniref:Uncharacterized protein n=1 Tax=Amoebophilus asiaticus (strain 5a2) TaxID=452471 RepID=B3ERN0_AMOA5|nr:SEL1-like repeat protein [Candidatus Amoebophilus asiaticus]ACE05882.1 hypothetical protein Aasi_0472 [Candidatus Amoebophilus asiaticus 5a2]